MTRLLTVTLFCLWSVAAFAQLPNQHGQVWKEYDIQAVTIPPPNIKSFDIKTLELPMPVPSIMEIVKRETGEAAWSGPGFGLIGTDGQRLFVYHTPAVQQKVAETIGRFQRQETKNVRFVMDTNFFTAIDTPYEHMGYSFSMGYSGDGDVGKAEGQKNADVASEPSNGVHPVFRYMHPILDSNGLRVCKQPGVNAYWVAKEDIPKFWDAQNKVIQESMRDRFLQCPQLVMYNGQLTAILDTASKPFVTDWVFDSAKNEFQPTITAIREGQTISSFSLLSWDGRTVSSDFHVEFSAISGPVKMDGGRGQGIPLMNRIMFSEKGLIFPADGMLVVHVSGPCQYVETRIEAGVPVLNKIPYLNRLYSNTVIGRDVRAVHGFLTVRMLAPNEVPQTAVVVPAAIRR